LLKFKGVLRCVYNILYHQQKKKHLKTAMRRIDQQCKQETIKDPPGVHQTGWVEIRSIKANALAYITEIHIELEPEIPSNSIFPKFEQ